MHHRIEGILVNVERTTLPAIVTVATLEPAPVSADVASTPSRDGFWHQRVVQNVLPFLSSLTVHASIILLGALTLKAVQVVSRGNLETMTTSADTPIEPVTP